MTMLVGFDPGNSDTTGLLTTPDGHTLTLTLPSVVGSGSLADVQRMRGGIGKGSLAPDEYALEYQGRSHFVGALAHRESADVTSQIGDVERYWNGHALRLLLTLVGTLIPASHATVQVVTGLPVSLWSQETVRKVQLALLGDHHFTLNGQASHLTVTDVAVIMEGAGALMVHGRQEPVPQAVIDIGGRTTDLFWAQGMTPVASRCAGYPVGVEKVNELLRAKAQETYGRYLSADEINAVLRAHATNSPPPPLFYQGKTINVIALVPDLLASVAAEITSFISQRWRTSEHNPVAADAAQVLLIGGGAHFFAKHLRELIGHLQVPEVPEQANARGYLAFGKQMQTDDWQRIRPTVAPVQTEQVRHDAS